MDFDAYFEPAIKIMKRGRGKGGILILAKKKKIVSTDLLLEDKIRDG